MKSTCTVKLITAWWLFWLHSWNIDEYSPGHTTQIYHSIYQLAIKRGFLRYEHVELYMYFEKFIFRPWSRVKISLSKVGSAANAESTLPSYWSPSPGRGNSWWKSWLLAMSDTVHSDWPPCWKSQPCVVEARQVPRCPCASSHPQTPVKGEKMCTVLYS